VIKIKRGLDIPMAGEPRQEAPRTSTSTHRVALIGPDYVGMKPTMLVNTGDKVRLGQKLFEDKKNPGVFFTSPGAGTVVGINRGDKRSFLSVEIALSGHAEEAFKSYAGRDLTALKRSDVQENLIDSGMWTAFKTRPFSRVPTVNAVPAAIFVPAMDTNPGAPDPELVIGRERPGFNDGLKVLSRLTDGKVFVCTKPASKIFEKRPDFVQVEEFSGPHPAGLVGTHIHFLQPVGPNKSVWTIGYQDVIAIGKLFTTGRLFVERVVALAGPQVREPSLLLTRLGAKISEITVGRLTDGPNRVISGSVLAGRKAEGAVDFLGRFHNQISVIEEGEKREFLGWQAPGLNKFSVKKIYASAAFPWKKFAFNANLNGSHRAMFPIGTYEKVMPLDIISTFFLRALLTNDVEQAIALGALELEEEDLALSTFVCPGKHDYGPLLRNILTQIEKEG